MVSAIWFVMFVVDDDDDDGAINREPCSVLLTCTHTCVWCFDGWREEQRMSTSNKPPAASDGLTPCSMFVDQSVFHCGNYFETSGRSVLAAHLIHGWACISRGRKQHCSFSARQVHAIFGSRAVPPRRPFSSAAEPGRAPRTAAPRPRAPPFSVSFSFSPLPLALP